MRGTLLPGIAAAAAALAAGFAALVMSPPPAHAQGGLPAPFPIVYQGEVYVDGVLLQDQETELTLRIGDWESRPALFGSQGELLSLVAGPPDRSYIGETITFHMDGMEASQEFVFPSLGRPRRDIIRLEFSTTDAPPNPVETPTPEGTAEDGGSSFPWAAVAGGVAIAGVALALLAVLALRLWRRARP